ncbi:hypothetical protein Tco_1089400, partial [Tanacetum coccineum]
MGESSITNARQWLALTAVASPQGSPQPTINLELPLIRETKTLFKMAGSQCNKFRGDKVKVFYSVPKRPRNATWYKDKAMLVEAQEAGQILDEEQLAFLADPRVLDGQAVQTIVPNNDALRTEYLDTCDSDCDDNSNTKAVLMANISNYGSDLISVVPHSETYLNDMENQSVHAMQDFEQTQVVDFIDNKIHSDSNIILYSQYLQETQLEIVQDTNLQAQQDSMILYVIEQMSEQMINHDEENIDFGRRAVDSKMLKKERKNSGIFFEENSRKAKAKLHPPLDKELDFACKHAQRIQELLVYVQDTCPNVFKLNAKKVAVTPKNKVKKVRFVEPLTSSSNIKQVESFTTSDSNTPVLSPTGLKCFTSNCGSKPTGNKRNDKISQTPSRNMKNKVEAQPRKVNKKNHVVKPIRDVDVKHSLLTANSICATCKKSMFDGVHDMCLLDFVKNVNSRAKSAKKHKNKIFGNLRVMFSLKFTSANVVPLKKTTSHSVETQKPELKVYSKKPKNVKNVGSSKTAKIVKSKNANHSELNHTWGSNATDISSSSSLVMTGCLDCSLIQERPDCKDHGGMVTISWVMLLSQGDTNLYTISLDDMLKTSSICLLSKASKTKSWLWHHRLSHLNFACALGKSKKFSHQPKAEDTNQEKLYLLHMDLYGPMHAA